MNETSPNISDLFALALKHHQSGRLADAEKLYRQILTLNPKHAGSLHLLGTIASQVGRNDIAVQLIGQAIALDAGIPAYHNNLGLALAAQNKFPEAEASYGRALALKPDLAEAHNNLGNALEAQGRLDQAIENFGRAISLKPGYIEACYNLGNALQAQGRLVEAVGYYERALALNPNYAEAYYGLGSALKTLGKPNDAAARYEQALSLKPNYAEAHNNLGAALMAQGKFADAVTSYRRAVALKPDLAEAHSNLGNVLKDEGRLAEASESYERARVLAPKALNYIYNAELLLPRILPSIDATGHWRERYNTGIETLSTVPGVLDDPARMLNTNSFDLAYHDADDRPTMEALRRLFRAKAPALTFIAPHVPGWQPPADGQCIRIGFLSQFLVHHTIGKLYQGLVRHLDRARFEVVLVNGPEAYQDEFGARLGALTDKTLRLSNRLILQQQQVAAEKLDVLFYPDIGISISTYFLAYARLAPVQAVSWGHPDTTGLDTVDYFVSAESIEPPNADGQYSERLVRLNRLPCFYEPLIAPTTIPVRVGLGLPEAGTLYGCPQAPFKLHPEFDGVLAEIALGDPDGHIVMLDSRIEAWSGLLRQRWAASHPILLERVVFLPHQPLDRFMALMAHFDVLLDPIHFGSGNTLYEAMVYGTPIVTWPGRFMRGRIVVGAYRQMGVPDAPIAERLEDYAPLVLALGRDPGRRRAIREASLARAGELFADKRAVREFEAFLEAAVAAAGRGEILQAGWRPP